jgi:hypothetical protein
MAAKSKSKDTAKKIIKKKVSRPGVHSKKKTSVLKSSKNWKKPYRGQGK